MPQAVKAYSEDKLTWADLRDDWDMDYGTVLLELRKQGLTPPWKVPKRPPEQQAILNKIFNEAGYKSVRPGEKP